MATQKPTIVKFAASFYQSNKSPPASAYVPLALNGMMSLMLNREKAGLSISSAACDMSPAVSFAVHLGPALQPI